MLKHMTVPELNIEIENLKASEVACQARLNHNLEKIDGRLASIDDKLDEKIGDLYSKVHENRRENDKALMGRPAPVYMWAFSGLTFLLGISVTIIGVLARLA